MINNNSNTVILEKASDIPSPDYKLPSVDIKLVKSFSFEPHILFQDGNFEKLDFNIIQQSNLNKKEIESTKLIADRFGSSCANAWLGSNYLYGLNNFKIDISKSKKYLLKANQSRHPKATYDLYVLYEKKGETKKSFEYLEKSAEYGYEDAIIQLCELCYRDENYSRALYLFKLSIVLEVKNYSRYYSLIGEIYYYGLGIPRDYEMAFKIFYDCSLRRKDHHSYFHLSQCYFYGHGVGKDFSRTVYWLNNCILDLNGEVSNCFGLLSLRGDETSTTYIKQDFKNALKFFEISKSKGYPNIETNIICARECLKQLECSNYQYINQLINKHYKEELKFNNESLKPASLRNKDSFDILNNNNNNSISINNC